VNAINQMAEVFPKADQRLKIGQIRRIQTDGLDAKLVVIYRVNSISQTSDVILLDHNLDNATNFDFISNFENVTLRFGHVVLKDFKGNVESPELSSSLVYAEVCQFCISAIGEEVEKAGGTDQIFPFSHDCYIKGSFELRILSDEWNSRNESYKDFFEACNKYINYDEFISRREAINLFYAHNSTLDLRKNLGSETSLLEVKKSMSTNKYAKMLVRS
jgi:hypothetical protein